MGNDYKELKRRLDSVYSHQWTDYAEQAVWDILETLEEYPEEDIYEVIYEATGEAFIYYSDAFDFLKEGNHYNFEDAFNEGYGGNVAAVATYFLQEEVFRLLNEIGLNY